MKLAAKAALFALVALLALQASTTFAHAGKRDGDTTFEDGHHEKDDSERRKPRFQTKFFNEE